MHGFNRWPFALIALAVFLVAACSSSSSGEAGVTRAVPPPSTGPGPYEPTDGGGPGVTSNDAAGPIEDGGGGADTEGACSTASLAVCKAIDACSHFLLVTVYGDIETCQDRAVLACTDNLAAPGVNSTPAELAACDEATSTQSCTAFLDGVLPSTCALAPGAYADGQACGSPEQCSGGDCFRAAGSFCGTCATLAAAGASCAAADCQAGLFCSKSQLCVAPAAEGAACSTDQPCDATHICESGTCAAPLEDGATCSTSNDECASYKGYYCHLTTNVCTLASAVAAGKTCGYLSDGSIATCEAGATCHGASSTATTGTCVAPAGDGQACDVTQGPFCLSPAYCNNGTCTLPNSASCN
jgi:hypothetical protein